MEEYKKFLAMVRKDTGLEAFAPDETGLVSVSVDDQYTLNLQYVEASNKVLCFVEVMTLGEDTPVKVYRDLLSAGLFGKDTGGGFFALEPESNILVYNYMFDLDAVVNDINVFVVTMENILTVCEIWEHRIKGGDDSEALGGLPINRMMV